LCKEIFELLLSAFLTNTTNKDLGCPLLFFAWNGTLWINLAHVRSGHLYQSQWQTHNLPVKVMFLQHDDVDRLWIFESQEAKPA
jgi:hypothetical protein